MAVRNLTHGTLVIKDGTSTPKTLTIPIMEGDLEFTEEQEAQTILNRGVLKEFTKGPEAPVSIRFSMTFEEWRGKPASTVPSVPDALKQRNEASSWTSTSTNEQGPYVVDLVFTLDAVQATGTGDFDEELKFSQFHCDSLRFSEGQDANRIEVSGKALVTTPVSTRAAHN